MTSVRAAALLVAAAALATFALPARRRAPEGPPAGSDLPGVNVRVGLVFDVGGRGDKSFNDASYDGLLRAHEALGVSMEVLEPASSEDREAGMRLFAARGFDLVIGVGFIFSSDVDRVARDFPAVKFTCVDYAAGAAGPPPNVAGLDFHEEQGSFLVGAVAGAVTHTGHVGFVGGMQTPLIGRFEAGYRAGVRATCPRCVVHAAYAGTTPDAFKDPAAGKSIAIAEIASGADVLYHAAGATGHGVFEAAHDARCAAIGVDSDQYDEMPDTVITSMIKRADVTVYDTVRAVVEGRFAGGVHVFGIADGAVDYVHDGPHAARLPPAVVARVEALRRDVVEGRVVVPTAP
ncbi:MAG TPA: BMP family ABC transporter substrate-binding protein [Polyangiaceae bacterium]|nr:BMP family ABC transporter substrate-binding protein [Polyangiaceae bacterium]